MKQEKTLLIGVAGIVIVFFLLRRLNTVPAHANTTKKTTIVKKTTYTPVTTPNYVKAHYNPYKAQYY
jgi:hypothetical protein